jgi:excisionase family DNA binding protein
MNDKVLTVKDVAAFLQISKAKIYRMISLNEIPYIKIERNVRIWESDLLEWLDDLTVPKKETAT